MAERRVPLSIGIYSRADAARLLGVTPVRLRRWVGGYTYAYRYRRAVSRRQQPPIVKPDLPIIDGAIALSFVELMELRVIKALVDKGISLHHVRQVADVARRVFSTHRPFASHRIFTDGTRVFASLANKPDMPDILELSRHNILQIIAGGLLKPFLDEIDFNASTALAEKWWPLGRDVPILLDPKVAFGAPAIAGTRLRTNVVVGMALQVSPEDAARTYGLDVEKVDAAVQFERQLAA